MVTKLLENDDGFVENYDYFHNGNGRELQKNWFDIVIVSPQIANANMLHLGKCFETNRLN